MISETQGGDGQVIPSEAKYWCPDEHPHQRTEQAPKQQGRQERQFYLSQGATNGTIKKFICLTAGGIINRVAV